MRKFSSAIAVLENARTVSDERRSSSKIFLLLNMDKKNLALEYFKGWHVGKSLGLRKLYKGRLTN